MVITSVNNEHIKELCKLKDKKYRDLTNTFLIEGEHLVNEALKYNTINELIVLDGYNIKSDVKTTYVSDLVMKKISNMDSYPYVIGVSSKIEEKEIEGNILILEDIQDPGNLGTIIRSASAFNIGTIILSHGCCDMYNHKVIRSTQGLIFSINIIVRDLEDIIPKLKEDGYKVYGTNVINGIDVREVNSTSKYALVIGNEGSGMSKSVSSLCDNNIYIKMNERVESLNAGVAASILLYELDR